MEDNNTISINLGPDPQPSGITAFDRRVANIRKRAESDPIAARDELWSWVNEVSSFAPYQRKEGLAELDRIFLAGQPFHEYADGHNIIGVPNLFVHPILDRTLRAILNLWQPWRGKHWSAAEKRGATTFTRSYAWLVRPFTPLYEYKKVGKKHIDGYFQPMNVRASVETPHMPTLVLDYPEGPSQAWVMSRVHDELTAIIPGVWLAKVFLHIGQRNVPFLYFPIKTALPGEAPIVLPDEDEVYPLPST